MATGLLNKSGLGPPWDQSSSPFGRRLRKAISCDSALLALHRFPTVRHDEVLAAFGWKPSQLARWYAAPIGQNSLIKTAMRQGTAKSTPGGSASNLPLVSAKYTVHICCQECMDRRAYWYLLLTRKDRAFSEHEIQTAVIWLWRSHCEFLQLPERRANRLLLGHDHRLILTDLDHQEQLLANPGLTQQLSAQFAAVLQQRYPNMEDDRFYDMVLRFSRQDKWVRFKRRRWGKLDTTVQWYIELRPVEPGELPGVGVLKDERIAIAVAYLHERYQEAPSLSRVAKHVHMSPFHFHRLFSKYVGVSPKQYLLRMQFHIAKWNLRTSTKPISDVAEQTGFSSHGHFTSTFHRMVGISPSEYRESH